MTDGTNNTHRTPALDKMGFARCRKDNKLFSWRKGGSCSVWRTRRVPTRSAPVTAPKPARARLPPLPRRKGSQTEPKRTGCRRVEEEGNKS